MKEDQMKKVDGKFNPNEVGPHDVISLELSDGDDEATIEENIRRCVKEIRRKCWKYNDRCDGRTMDSVWSASPPSSYGSAFLILEISVSHYSTRFLIFKPYIYIVGYCTQNLWYIYREFEKFTEHKFEGASREMPFDISYECKPNYIGYEPLRGAIRTLCQNSLPRTQLKQAFDLICFMFPEAVRFEEILEWECTLLGFQLPQKLKDIVNKWEKLSKIVYSVANFGLDYKKLIAHFTLESLGIETYEDLKIQVGLLKYIDLDQLKVDMEHLIEEKREELKKKRDENDSRSEKGNEKSGSDEALAQELSGLNGGDDVRAPLPVIRDDAMLTSRIGYPSHGPSSVVAFHNFEEEMKHPAIWESELGGSSSTESSRDNLALCWPPFALIHQGPFEKVKLAAASEDKWLLANLLSPTEFSSHMLNKDTWANEVVAQTIKTNFIFWQVYDDTSEGKKVRTYYKIESVPVILVIDPVTGQKMCSWPGMVLADRLLKDLMPFMDSGPKNYHSSLSHKLPRESSDVPAQRVPVETNDEDEQLQQALAASMENMNIFQKEACEDKAAVIAEEEEACSTKKPVYLTLPEEPKEDRSLLCLVGVCLPDGSRIQRNFLRTDPVQLLWSFCSSQLGEAETRPFRLTHAIPGATKTLEYDSNLTFEESGLANSMILVTWE